MLRRVNELQRAASHLDLPVTLHPPFRVGAWRVLPASNELCNERTTVHLEPKAMELLVFLADRPGEVVSRDALLAAIWPGVVVADEVLTQAVNKLRRAVGDEVRSPAFIETISKRGYRLIAPVVQPGQEMGATRGTGTAPGGDPGAPVVPAGNGVSGVTHATGSPRRGRQRTTLLLAAGAFGVAIALAGGYLLQTGDHPGPADSSLAPEDLAPERWGTLPTITVVPFETLTGDESEAYLARGIAADLITDLARIAELRVISAVPGARGDGDTAAGRGHAARYIVSGSLQRTSAQLKVNIRLIDSETGTTLWSQRYERPIRDLFSLQEEIIGQVAQALPVKLSEAERRRIAARDTRNLEAYDAFLRAQSALLVRQREQNGQARELYRHAIELDPAFARAYAGLALTYAADYRNQWAEDGQQALARAEELAQSAQRIHPRIPEVYWVLGYVRAQQREHPRALEYLHQAIAIDRSFADAYALMGGIHTYAGRPAQSIPLLRTAVRLNPASGYLYFLLLGRAYFFLGDAEQAVINLREALARNPANLEARVYHAAALALAGDRDAAAWEIDEIRGLQGDFTLAKWLDTYPMTDVGQKQRLAGLLAQAGMR